MVTQKLKNCLKVLWDCYKNVPLLKSGQIPKVISVEIVSSENLGVGGTMLGKWNKTVKVSSTKHMALVPSPGCV